jgi:serine protease
MKSVLRRGLVAPCLSLVLLAATPVMAMEGLDSEAAWQKAIDGHTDRLIVKYKAATAAGSRTDREDLSRVIDAAQRAGVGLRHMHVNAVGAHVMEADRLLDLADARALAKAIVQANPEVDFASPDYRMHALYSPSDNGYVYQWHYQEATGGINAPLAWDKTVGGGAVVAVVDSGYRTHPDLLGNIVGGYDFITGTFNANDGNGRDSSALDPGDWVEANACGNSHPAHNSTWHGTHTAGTIAAIGNNTIGGVGVAYGAKVVSARVLGRCGAYTSDMADAITWASGGTVNGVPANPNPARVINVSIGGKHSCPSAMQYAVNEARSRGAVVVVSAGNANANAGDYSPANCAGVITVAASNRSGARASYSNFGSVVDISAPGGDSDRGVYSTVNTGKTTPATDSYAYYSGTSMAAPHVAGVAALMLSRNAGLSPDEVEAKLKSSARVFPIACPQCGAGIVDANAAVIAAGIGGPGKFAYVSMSRTSPGSSGDIATILIRNAGSKTITGVGYNCSSLSWHGYGNAPSSISPGATVSFQCQAAASGAYAPPVFTVTGTASNSPYTPQL